MPDFPRTWTYTALEGPGISTVITIPGVPAVTHVLDSFLAIVENSTTSIWYSQLSLYSSDGAFTAGVAIGLVAAAADSPGSDSASGLDYAASPGASLTIEFTVTHPSGYEFLRVQGHSI
jgi:hypothetical protein